jgi:hypothetical protein
VLLQRLSDRELALGLICNCLLGKRLLFVLDVSTTVTVVFFEIMA